MVLNNNFFIIIPAYNEAFYLGNLLEKLESYKKQVIVVDDGSFDKTAEIVEKKGFKVLKHIVNLGKGAALKTGVKYALSKGAFWIIFMDADGQHEVSDIRRFLNGLEKYDLVLGKRSLKIHRYGIRALGNFLLSFFLKILFGVKISDPLCGFRGFRSSIYDAINWSSSDYGVEMEIIIKAIRNRIPFTEVSIKTRYLDYYKGVSIFEAYQIFFNMLKWRLFLW